MAPVGERSQILEQVRMTELALTVDQMFDWQKEHYRELMSEYVKKIKVANPLVRRVEPIFGYGPGSSIGCLPFFRKQVVQGEDATCVFVASKTIKKDGIKIDHEEYLPLFEVEGETGIPKKVMALPSGEVFIFSDQTGEINSTSLNCTDTFLPREWGKATAKISPLVQRVPHREATIYKWTIPSGSGEPVSVRMHLKLRYLEGSGSKEKDLMAFHNANTVLSMQLHASQ